MADSQKDQLLTWLNDAHAMETSIGQVLENHASDAKDHPKLQARIQQHLAETKIHADLVEGLIKDLGGSVSSAKSGMSSVMGRVQGASTAFADDELVKNALSDFSTEYFEIASYTAIIAAARKLNASNVVSTCQTIVRDEQAMAKFLDDNLPTVVDETLSRKAA